MTISHDTATVAAAYASTGTQNTSHLGSANVKAAVVLIDQNGSTTDEVSGVTYGGVAMTRLDRNTEATEPGAVYTYYLLNPPTGTQTVAMTTTASTNKQLMCATMNGDPLKAIKLAGARPFAFFGTSAGAANPSWNITGLTAGRKLEAYEVIHSGLQSMTNTPATNWTLISSTDLGSQGRGFARQSVASQSGTTLACGWIAATSEDFVGNSVVFWEDTNLMPEALSDSWSFEDGTIGGWSGNSFFGSYETTAALANSALHPTAGTKSLEVTWPATVAPEVGAAVAVGVEGHVVSQAYGLFADVWVPSGSSDVKVDMAFVGSTGQITTKDASVSVMVIYTASQSLHLPAVIAEPSTNGSKVYVDNIRVIAVFTLNISSAGSNTSSGALAVTRTTTISAGGSNTSGGGIAATIVPGTTTYDISASGTNTSGGSLAVGTVMPVSASGTNTSSGSAAITRTTTVSASGSNVSGGSAAITRTTDITASGSNTSSGALAVGTVMPVSASGSNVSGGSAAITRTTDISASGTNTSSGALAVTATTTISAAGSNTSGGSAAVTRTTEISASGSNTSSGALAVTSTTTVSADGSNTSGGALAVTSTTTISASGSNVSDGSLAVTATTNISASGANTSGGSLAAGTVLPVSASGANTSSGSMAATVESGPITWGVSASGSNVSSGTAEVTLTAAAGAAGSNTTGGSLDATVVSGGVTHDISGSGSNSSGGSAALGVLMTLSASGFNQLAGSAAMTILGQLGVPVTDPRATLGPVHQSANMQPGGGSAVLAPSTPHATIGTNSAKAVMS